MMAPVQLAPPRPFDLRLELRLAETRRATQRDLDALGQILHTFGATDSYSQRISAWEAAFREALRLPNFSAEVRTKFLSQLQRLLHDSLFYKTPDDTISFPPLDEEAMLGSDGRVYGKRFLAVVLYNLPQERRRRSPHNEDHALSLKPHLPVKFLVEWLQREGMYATDPVIDELYSQVFEHRRPFLPMEEAPETTRRKLQAELIAMQECAASMGDDPLSQNLRQWIARFASVLTTEQELLASLSAHLAGLGEKPYLGTDGLVYGEMSLAVLVSERFWPHTATPHALARHLADWLWSKGYSVEEPQEVKEHFYALEQQGALIAIPAPLEEGQRDRLAPFQRVADRMREVDREIAQELRQADEQLRSERVRLRARIEQLGVENEALRRAIQRANARLDSIERRTEELQIACNNVEQKIEEAKESGLISIVGCVAAIALSFALKTPIIWTTP